jgi:hypothetical protein
LPALTSKTRNFLVSDIFREIEEDVRRERFEKLWKTYGDYVIAAIAVVMLAVAAYLLWNKHEQRAQAKAAIAFSEAQQIGDPAKAAAAFGKIADSAPRGYAQLARMEQANALSISGKQSEAIALYKQVATHDNGALSGAARIRAGWAMADTVAPGQLADWLAPLTKTNTAWSQSAREILAYADYRSGKAKAAQAAFEALAKDMQAPDGVRERAGAMASFLKNGAGKDFGTVPPPPKPAAPAAEKPAP